MSISLIQDWNNREQPPLSPTREYFKRNKFQLFFQQSQKIEGERVNIMGTEVLFRSGKHHLALHSFKKMNILEFKTRQYWTCIDGISHKQMFVKYSSPILETDLSLQTYEKWTYERLRDFTQLPLTLQKELKEVFLLFNDYQKNSEKNVSTFFAQKLDGTMRFAVVTPFCHNDTLFSLASNRANRLYNVVKFLAILNGIGKNDVGSNPTVLSNPRVIEFFKEATAISAKILKTLFDSFKKTSYSDLALANLVLNENDDIEVIDLETVRKHGELGIDHIFGFWLSITNRRIKEALIDIKQKIEKEIRLGNKISDEMSLELEKCCIAQDKFSLGALLAQFIFSVPDVKCFYEGSYRVIIYKEMQKSVCVSLGVNFIARRELKLFELIEKLIDDPFDLKNSHQKLVEEILKDSQSCYESKQDY